MTIFYSLLFSLLGLVLGSGLNCLSYRLARHQDWVHGTSVCPACGARLTAIDLVPLFSWLFLRGKCRHCGAKISVRYPLTELLSGLAFLAIYLKYDLTLSAAAALVLYCCLLCLSLVDLDIQEIPNIFLLIPALARVAQLLIEGGLAGLWYGLWHSLLLGGGMLLLVLLLEKLLKKEAMGGGDLKLIFVLGLFFTVPEFILMLFLACLFGLLLAVLINGRNLGLTFAFGPALSLSAMLTLLYSAPLINWYLSLF